MRTCECVRNEWMLSIKQATDIESAQKCVQIKPMGKIGKEKGAYKTSEKQRGSTQVVA